MEIAIAVVKKEIERLTELAHSERGRGEDWELYMWDKIGQSEEIVKLLEGKV